MEIPECVPLKSELSVSDTETLESVTTKMVQLYNKNQQDALFTFNLFQ